MARIFAKALNCDEGFGLQCNECENCKAIIEGRHPASRETTIFSSSKKLLLGKNRDNSTKEKVSPCLIISFENLPPLNI